MTFSANPISSAPISADRVAYAVAAGITGTLAATNANDTLVANGTVTNPAVSGAIAATNANDTMTATGVVPVPPPVVILGGGGGGSFVPDESERRKSDREKRAELRRAITRAIEGPEPVQAEALEVLAPYMPPTAPERVKGAEYVISRLNWAQMSADVARISATLQAIADEQEEEEAFLLML